MSQISNLKKHLENKKFAANTIRQNLNYATEFLTFLKAENLSPEEAKYTDILAFIEILRDENKSTRGINRYLLAIRHLYNFTDINKNPAEGVILKGITRKVPDSLLEEKELKEIYETYPVFDLRGKRNKVILSLLINQAVTTQELHKLKPEHLLLEKGKIIIPGSKRSNQRTLKLESSQIIELYEYTNKIRPEILSAVTKGFQHFLHIKQSANSDKQFEINRSMTLKNIHKAQGRKPDKINIEQIEKQLFISSNGSENIKNSLYHLFAALKKRHPEIKNAKQIRMSVITNKLKNNNLREVQYFAGHKYGSSTERYKLNNIEDLKKEIGKYHPLNNLKM